MLNNKTWWKAAFVRALRTVAQTAVATIGTAALIERVNWLAVLSASALAGVLSLLTSLAGLPEVREEQDGDEADATLPSRHTTATTRTAARSPMTALARSATWPRFWMRTRKRTVTANELPAPTVSRR